MSELRMGPDRSPSSYYPSGGLRSNGSSFEHLKASINALVASLPLETQQAIRQLAKADPATRNAILAKLDEKTATMMKTIVVHL